MGGALLLQSSVPLRVLPLRHRPHERSVRAVVTEMLKFLGVDVADVAARNDEWGLHDALAGELYSVISEPGGNRKGTDSRASPRASLRPRTPGRARPRRPRASPRGGPRYSPGVDLRNDK